MTAYVIRRVLLILPTALLVALILFLLVRILPGDAIDSLLGDDNASFDFTEADRLIIRQELGLDRPLPVQFGKWAWGAVRFDFGTSFWGKRPISAILRESIGRTLSITVMGLFLGIAWGITSGVISGVKQNTWVDHIVRVVTVGGLSMPQFFIAVMLFWVLIRAFNWIPPIGYESFWSDPSQNIKQVSAPILILAYTTGASISRITRSQFLEVFREDYVRTARAKGLGENVVIIRHVLRNSILPVITVSALLVGLLLSGVVILEKVFGIPGMGNALLTAINRRDYPLLQAIVWLISLIFIFANLAVDIAYGWIDPRIRYS